MLKIIFISIILIPWNSFSMGWGLQIVDNKKTVRKFKPKDILSKIPLEKSAWNCYLSKTLNTKEGFARSVDCKYGKTSGMISAKLFCARPTPPSLGKAKSTTFAIAEDKGEGFLFELRCFPNE